MACCLVLLIWASQLLQFPHAAFIRAVEFDAHAECPGAFTRRAGPGVSVCTRSSMTSSASFDMASVMSSSADPHGLGVYSRIEGSIRAYQFYYTKAFCVNSAQPGICSASRDTTSVESDTYVDGVSVTLGLPGSRSHIHTLAVASSTAEADPGITAGPAFRDDLCPCSGSSGIACSSNAASNAPGFVGSDLTCAAGYGGDGIPDNMWHPQPFEANFSVSVSDVHSSPETAFQIEVRLMGSQGGLYAGVTFQDVGIESMWIDIFEEEDYTPPVLTVAGSASPEFLVGTGSLAGIDATCVDDVDGPLPVNVTGEVNFDITGWYVLTFTCEDQQTNVITASRLIRIYDLEPPVMEMYGSVSQCIEEGDPYVEGGAACADAYEGSLDVSTNGTVNTEEPGTYFVEYSCEDTSGNRAFVTRTAHVLPDSAPGSLHMTHVELDSGGARVQVGYGGVLTNVDPSTTFRLQWSGLIAFPASSSALCFLLTVEAHAKGGKPAEATGTLEATQLSSLASVSASGDVLLLPQDDTAHGRWAGLRDLTFYTVTVGEHFLLDQHGRGSVQQVFMFETGDYTGPILATSAPAYGDLAWPADRDIELTFSEQVQPGSGGSVRLRRDAEEAWEELPSNETMSWNGLSVTISIGAFQSWASCMDMQVSIDATCFADMSVNQNPAESAIELRFVTSCVVSVDPPDGSLGVSILAPLVLSFSEVIQTGDGNVSLAMLGGDTQFVSAADFPLVRAQGNDFVVDLGCQTRFCSTHGLARYLDSSQGWCTGREPQRCKGLTLLVSLGERAVLLANRTWSQESLLANYTDALPAQLDGGYSFVLETADLTGPVVLSTVAAATSATTLRVTVRLAEGGRVHCAALGDFNTVPCSLNISSDLSAGLCDTESFECSNRYTMHVSGGCFGVFAFEGEEILCGSADVTDVTCTLSTSPSWSRVAGVSGRRDAGASAMATCDVAAGYAEATMMLEGLVESESYVVACAARDLEQPHGNAMDSQGIIGTARTVTTLDQTPPSLTSVSSPSAALSSVDVQISLSEAGVAYCLHAQITAPVPSREELIALGTRNGTGENWTATMTIKGMFPDQEYVVYCTARDLAGSHPNAGPTGDNWAVSPASLLVHTRGDAQPPSLLSIFPDRDTYSDCLPESPVAYCIVQMKLVFDEDIFFGPSGLMYLECAQVGPPVACAIGEKHVLNSSNAEIVNQELHITTPAVSLQSTFKLVVESGGLKDGAGNPFSMDIECFPAGTPYGCKVSYFFNTAT